MGRRVPTISNLSVSVTPVQRLPGNVIGVGGECGPVGDSDDGT